MSLQAVAWAIECQDMPLDERTGRTLSSAKLVLMALSNHAGRHGEDCFPSVATVQDYTGLSDRMIQYALRRLEEHGTIAKTPDPMVRQSTIGRQDKRPQSYDIVAFNGVQDRKTAITRGAKSKIELPDTGCNVSGDLAPEPVLEPVGLKDEPKSTPSVSADAPPCDPPQPPLINPPVTPVQAGVQPEHRQDEEDPTTAGVKVAGNGHLPLLDESSAGRSCSPAVARKQLAEQHWPEFWAVYDHKQAKAAARKAWDRVVIRDKVDPQEVVNAAKRYRGTFNGDRTYMKHPARWLNAGCWEDELPGQPVSRSVDDVRARLRELVAEGNAEAAAREAGVPWSGWQAQLTPDERLTTESRREALARWGRVWIGEHETELVAGMTRRTG